MGASIDWDEYLHDLRLSTMEVTSPLIHLAARRLEMLKATIEFIKSMPETPQQRDLLEQYNSFVINDQELVAIARGKADDSFNRPR